MALSVLVLLLAANLAIAEFLEEPGPGPLLVPVGEQARLSCSVVPSYHVVWRVELPDLSESSSTDQNGVPDSLESRGFSLQGLNTPSSVLAFVINNGTTNNATTVTCVAVNSAQVLKKTAGTEVEVIFYDIPSVPTNLRATENGLHSLNISWSVASIIEGVPTHFRLTAINLNASSTSDPIVVSGIEDQHYIFIVEDSTPCVVYSFQVTAMNEAGSSDPSEMIIRSVPTLPDISLVEESLHYSLEKNEEGVLMNATFKVEEFCMEHPVLNYTLILESVEFEIERIEITTHANVQGEVNEISVPLVLTEDSQYSLEIEVANDIGSVRTQPRIISTSDVQEVTFTRLANGMYQVTCTYLNGSDALGCVYTLISRVEGLENVTGTIRRRSDTDNGLLQMIDNIDCYSELLVYDLESDNSTGRIPFRTAINNVTEGGCSSPAGLGEPVVIIVIVIAVVLLAGLFLLLDLVIALILYKGGICGKRKGKPGGVEQRSTVDGTGASPAVQNGNVAADTHRESMFANYLRQVSGTATEQTMVSERNSVALEPLYSTLSNAKPDCVDVRRPPRPGDRNGTLPRVGAEDGGVADNDDPGEAGHLYHVLEYPDLLSQRESPSSAFRPDSGPPYHQHIIPAHTPPTSHSLSGSLPRKLPATPPSSLVAMVQQPRPSAPPHDTEHCVYAEIGAPMSHGQAGLVRL